MSTAVPPDGSAELPQERTAGRPQAAGPMAGPGPTQTTTDSGERSALQRQRERFGGVKIGASFFGWLAAAGAGTLLTALLAAVGAGFGLSTSLRLEQVTGSAGTLGIISAVVVLAVAMAFVTAFLSMYVDVGLRPHPGFEQSGRLVTLGQTDGRNLGGLPRGLVDRLAEGASSVEAVAGVIQQTVTLTGSDERLAIEFVTESYFSGIRPRLHSGRGFDPADHDPEADKVVVVSYRYWRDVHGPIGAAMPGVRRYIQNHAGTALDGSPAPCDGFAEIWFDDMESMLRALSSPEGLAAQADAVLAVCVAGAG